MSRSSRRVTGYWIYGLCIAAAGAVIWIVAILIMPGEGWERPGKVTAFGLVLLVGVVIIALAMHRKGWERMDRARTDRRRRRREHAQPDEHRSPKQPT